MKQNMVGGLPGKVLGLLADLLHKLQHGVHTAEELNLFLQRKNPFAITGIRSEWSEFYRKHFRLAVDFDGVIIPDDPGGFDRVLLIPQNLTLSKVLKTLHQQTKFRVWTYREDLDKGVPANARNTKQSYAIRLRDRSDAELNNLSANQLQERGENVITLLEQLIFELKYFDETGKRPNLQNATLCGGTRDSDGSVPLVHWNSDFGQLSVDCCGPDDAYDMMRGRLVIS